MTRVKLAAPTFLARGLATTAVIALLSIQFANNLPDRRAETVRNVELARLLMAGGASAAQDRDPLPSDCQDYLPTIALLNNQELSPQHLIAQAERWSSCWPEERRRLLNARLFDAMAVLGQWDDVCRELTSVQAVDKLLTLAEQAETGGNWQDVQIYLACLEESDWDEAWVSPWRVAVLYQHLGQILEGQQAFVEAIAAYEKAADWHPGVWALPYLQGASLLWRHDRETEAADWLIKALNRNPDDAAAFELWYQMAVMWAEQGDEANSLCAYREAVQLLERMPPPTMVDLVQLERSVEAASVLATEECFEGFPTLRSR